MKKKEVLDDLEIYIDPKPLTKEEELALSLFIKQLKAKKAQRPKRSHIATRRTKV